MLYALAVKFSWFLPFVMACGGDAVSPPDAPATDTFSQICHSLVHGPRDQACFSLNLGDPGQVIAQRSHTILLGYSRGAGTVVSATSDAPALFTITDLTVGSPDDAARDFVVSLTANQAGDGDVVLRDDQGAEIDRVTLHVRASDELAVDGGLSAPALVLAGEVTTLHVTTKTAGQITVGTGAVAFTPSGGVAAAMSTDAPWLDATGDTAFVHVTGDGAILAEAPDATATVAITAVAASALTTIAADPMTVSFPASDSKTIAIGATAAGTPVYGPRCAWSNTGALSIALSHGFFDASNYGIGTPAVYHYKIEGAAGDYHPLCTLPGGLSVTVDVHVAP